MASIYDKKFKTTDATKAGGAEVVSDPIELSPRTKNHVFVVTSDSSLSGTVDVEVEMSPDGTNWCPAVTRTQALVPGGSVTEIVGNEESVKLTPDVGEFKNKHARGGLNFDVSGSVVTPDGSGARDLLDQHVAINKSFNYSQWFKTSEVPTTTYKPVLFRHGGHDTFENTKNIETDNNTSTQNLCEQAGISNTQDSSGLIYTPSTITGFTGLNPDNSFTTVSWMDLNKIAASGTVYSGNNIVATNNTGIYMRDTNRSIGDRMYVYLQWRNGVAPFYGQAYFDITDYTKALCIIKRVDASAGVGNTGVAHVDVIDSDGTSLYNHQVNYTIPSGYSISGNTWTAQSEWRERDEVAFLNTFVADGDLNTLYETVGSNIQPKDFTHNANLMDWYRFGDNGTDTKALVTPIKGTFPTIANSSFTSSDAIPALATSDLLYIAAGNNQNIFGASNSLSISGWFKTTDTGTLFSNTGGAVATGMTMEVTSTGTVLTHHDSSLADPSLTVVNDGNWHHLVFTYTSGSQKTFIDGVEISSTTSSSLTDDDLKGTNGFTLLGDGQENSNQASPGATDASKLIASISNWSLHSEVLSADAVKQIYSNGHVRNIKNLPSVASASIKAWWQLQDPTTPEQDSSGNTVSLVYQDAASAALTTKLATATGEVLAEDVINGNAMTISLTKSFNFTTKKWVETADQDTALCLSFNGFEEQAEYFAIWKCSQTIAGSTIDICDGAWHNVILSYRGNNDLSGSNVSEGDSVLFGPGPANSLAYHWALSFDGEPLTAINDGSGADYIGGVNTIATASYNATTYNVSFPIYNRHLKYNSGNAQEVYKPHAQFSAGIHEVVGVNNNNAFQGYVDETSFHSDCWWVDQAGTSVITNTLNAEKPATVYGNTTALSNRGAGTEYLSGVPYPLNDPAKIGSARGSNQFINPYRKGETQEDAATSIGGLEGWWRWGDTPGDCSITINDVKDHNDSINARDVSAFGIVTADRQVMTSSDSIYLADRAAGTAAGSIGITFPQVKLEGISSAICNIKEILSPLLQFVRVKWKGAGSVDLGEGKGEARICHTNRIRRRKK